MITQYSIYNETTCATKTITYLSKTVDIYLVITSANDVKLNL